jgi:hypothetical protein
MAYHSHMIGGAVHVENDQSTACNLGLDSMPEMSERPNPAITACLTASFDAISILTL